MTARTRRTAVNREKGVCVVRFLNRKIIDHQGVEQLGEELQELVNQPDGDRILLNFADVEFLSSAALNEVLQLLSAVKRRGGRLKLCNLGREVREILLMTRLNQLFEVADEEKEAYSSF